MYTMKGYFINAGLKYHKNTQTQQLLGQPTEMSASFQLAYCHFKRSQDGWGSIYVLKKSTLIYLEENADIKKGSTFRPELAPLYTSVGLQSYAAETWARTLMAPRIWRVAHEIPRAISHWWLHQTAAKAKTIYEAYQLILQFSQSLSI